MAGAAAEGVEAARIVGIGAAEAVRIVRRVDAVGACGARGGGRRKGETETCCLIVDAALQARQERCLSQDAKAAAGVQALWAV